MYIQQFQRYGKGVCTTHVPMYPHSEIWNILKFVNDDTIMWGARIYRGGTAMRGPLGSIRVA